MKNLIVIAITCCAFQFVTAQNHQDRKRVMNFTAEEIANLQTKKMTLALDLNEKQQDEVYLISLENAKLRKANLKERKERKESRENNKPTKKEHLQRMHNMLDHKIAIKAKMKDILNDEQYKKWEKIAAKKEAKKRKMHKNWNEDERV